MAAAAVAMRAAFTRIGFSVPAAVFITDQQGLTTVSQLVDLRDEAVSNLCKAVRRPGGVVAGGGVNPGQPVSILAEENLKLTCYFARHRIRVSHDTVPNDITMVNITAMRELRDFETSHEDPEVPEVDERDWPKTIDAIREHLANCYGTTGIPLAYVIRENVNPPAADPPGGYDTEEEEMIARAPHRVNVAANAAFTAQYKIDRGLVYEKLKLMTQKLDCWTYVKQGKRGKDGRAAFFALFNHYLGPNNVDSLAHAAERKLQTTTYDGERKRWNFEKYVKVHHVDQHAILEQLQSDGDHNGIDARSKVRHLMDRIKTDSLNAVKTRIMSDPGLRNDFERCVTLYKDFIAQTKANSTRGTNMNVASITSQSKAPGGSHNKSGGKGASSGGTHVEDRYYKSDEYKKLTQQQKKKLKEMCESRNKRKRNNGADNNDKKARKVAAAATNPTDSGTDSESSEDEQMDMKSKDGSKKSGNRNHPALTRQSKQG